MAHFHIPDDVLMSYAAGTLDEARSLLVATHLTLCPSCRHTVSLFESVNAEIAFDGEDAPMAKGALDTLMARLDDPPKPMASVAPPAVVSEIKIAGRPVPQPLAPYLAGITSENDLPWRSATNAMDMWDVPVAEDALKTRLLRVKGGRRMPEHTHMGEEMILVLTGGFTDERGHYVRGDVSVSDDTQQHSPIADEGEDCIALVVIDAPLKLTGPISRFLNPFVRF